MPPKKQVANPETVKCKVRVVPIKGAKQAALRVQVGAYTTPLAYRKMLGGCYTTEDGANPIDTAFVCAIVQSMSQCCAIAKNSKNVQVEFKWSIAYGMLCLTIVVPPTGSAIKHAMTIYKKAFSSKIPTRAYKLLSAVTKEFKDQREQVMETLAYMCNNWNFADAFIKAGAKVTQAKVNELQGKLEHLLPKRLDNAKQSIASKTRLETPECYVAMSTFGQMPENVRAVILTAVHAANLDFYTDVSYKQLFIHTDNVAPQFLNLVKQFIKGRLRFLVNYWAESKHTEEQKAKFATKMEALPMLVYANSSVGLNIHSQLQDFLDKNMVSRFETLGSKFNTYFKK